MQIQEDIRLYGFGTELPSSAAPAAKPVHAMTAQRCGERGGRWNLYLSIGVGQHTDGDDEENEGPRLGGPASGTIQSTEGARY